MRNSEVCTPEVATVTGSASVAEAARLMRERHIGCVVVVEGTGRMPVGIVTDRDLVVEVLATGIDPRAVTVGDIMSMPLITASEDGDPLRTLKVMRIRGIRRVPIVDAEGRLAGIASLDDLLEIAGDAMIDAVGAISSERAMEGMRRR